MREELSFGAWLKRRRKALDLTQAALAQRVGCAGVTIRKFESDEQRPSRPMAERLAQHLQLAPEEWARFVQFARVGLDDAPPVLPIPASAHLPMPGAAHQAVRDASVPSVTPATAPDLLPSLPQPVTSLIGRTTELAEIATLLDDPACRLLTLTGSGGIGKTRLALAVAAARTRRYPHGIWFVDLSPLSSAEHVVSAIADTFKLTGMGVGDPQDALRNYLRAKTLLLVLDNFEHVLAAPA